MRRSRHRWLGALAATALTLCAAPSAGAQEELPPADELPLPEPRPDEEAAEPEDAAQREGAPEEHDEARPGRTASGPPPGPRFDLEEAKACETALRRKGVQFELLEPIDDGGGCGTQRPLRIKQVGDGIAIASNVRLRCKTARALHDWVDEVVAPSAQTHLDAELTALRISTSYQCRRRNNAPTGKLSEHAFANGVDVMAFVFEGRPPVPVAPRPDSDRAERAFQAAARGGACAYFTTVLGPGTDATHQAHFHLDLAERSGGYRICQ